MILYLTKCYPKHTSYAQEDLSPIVYDFIQLFIPQFDRQAADAAWHNAR
jgi:hypothetical protein